MLLSMGKLKKLPSKFSIDFSLTWKILCVINRSIVIGFLHGTCFTLKVINSVES